MHEPILRAAESIVNADALLITAGAGMGVDSGLPDFRGNEGFWKAYPPMRHLGLSFSEMANPAWFHRDPAFAWGFYGHRLNLYRKTVPHVGFAILRTFTKRMTHEHFRSEAEEQSTRMTRARTSAPEGQVLPAPTRHESFVFTSNVDGAFQRAGFSSDRIAECHGAIDYVQCLTGCGAPTSRADDLMVDVDEETFRAKLPLPSCPRCGGIVRPNILMFGDSGWDDTRTTAQELAFESWLRELPAEVRLVVVECGAGTAIPTVRAVGDRLARMRPRTSLIRINVREPETRGQIEIALGAKAALEQIDAQLQTSTRLGD